MRRPRITRLLDEAVQRPVTIVTGPAGTGKTLAVADWTREGSLPGPAVWVSLDRGDGIPSRLWTSIVSAILVSAGHLSVHGLQIPDQPDADFLGAVAENVGGSLVLILDDVHELDPGVVLDWLDSLLRWPPQGVRIVMVSRHDPPLSLQRLRLEGKLAEVRFSDLAFTTGESRELLDEWGVTLSASALENLMGTTGGWAAALRLAALTLRVADDPSAAIERFGGPTFLVSEYLWDTVLRLLPDNYSAFLLRTSITSRICAPLAVALTGEERSDHILRTLAQEELLVQELEGTGWYRTHSLLTEVLRARLQAERPDLARDLHRKAALWFEERQSWLESLRHALASGDWDFAGMIATRSGAITLFGPDREGFVELMAQVPGGPASDQPELMAALAVAAYSRHDSRLVAPLIARAEAAVAVLGEPRRSIATLVLRTVAASQAHREGDAPAMARAAVRADELLAGLSAADAPGWSHIRGIALAMRGAAELWSGHPQTALDLLDEAVTAYPVDQKNGYSEVYYRGIMALAQNGIGALAEGRATAAAALDSAHRWGRGRSYETQWAWLALALTDVYAGDAEAAKAALAACDEAGGARLNPFVRATMRVLRGWLAYLAGDVAAARRQLGEADAWLAEHPAMATFHSQLTALRVDVELAAGNPDRARAALEAYDQTLEADSPDPKPFPDAVTTCRARLLLATGRPEEVRPTLAHLLDHPGLQGARSWLTVALAEDRLRHDSRAIEALSRALDIAEAQGVFLPFVHPSPALASALRRHLEVVGTHRQLVQRALASVSGQASAPGRTPASERLTERELAVLAFLPTMGSNAEIARALSISENTVKQHLKSIFRKLGVTSRRDAVRVARDLGLVPWLAAGASAPLRAPLPPGGS